MIPTHELESGSPNKPISRGKGRGTSDAQSIAVNQKQGRIHPEWISIIATLALSCSLHAAPDLQYTIAPYGYWQAMACSSDGSIVVASELDNHLIYVSTDSGATFRPSTKLPAVGLVCTPDASTIVAIAGMAYSSHDLGVTWKTNSLPGKAESVVISADGTKWVCGNGNTFNKTDGPIYVSADAGGSWQQTSAPLVPWTSIACSADGNRLAAVYGGSQVYTSSDRGLTWTNTMPGASTNFLYLVVSSSDGNKLVTIGDGIVCVSANAGNAWERVGVAPGFIQVAASADASTLAPISGPQLLTSTNSGALWTPRTVEIAGSPYPVLPHSVSLSADGNRLFMSSPGLVFTSPLPPAVLSFSWQSNDLALSWPSNQIGFVLESTPALAPSAIWTLVTSSIFAGDYQYFVTNDLKASPSAFYRLHKIF